MSQIDANFWNNRYSEPDGPAYGDAPNEFLVEALGSLLESFTIPAGARVLCLAEGEGRNAIYLAKMGFNVYAVDLSSVGMRKLGEKASTLGLSDQIKIEVVDLNDFDFARCAGPGGWDLIISIFAHTSQSVRVKVHQAVKQTLKRGGYFILEAYTPRNIGRGTGGPQSAPVCVTSANLGEELFGLEVIKNTELERVVNEGKYHEGLSSVVQFIGKQR
jgi:SAM-dependent methyltransferase